MSHQLPPLAIFAFDVKDDVTMTIKHNVAAPAEVQVTFHITEKTEKKSSARVAASLRTEANYLALRSRLNKLEQKISALNQEVVRIPSLKKERYSNVSFLFLY